MFDVELVDLRDHPLTFFDGYLPVRTGRDYADEAVVRFGRVIDRADGYVVLTAEYNHGYPAVLKNALDSTFVEWRRKPVAFVGVGQHRRGACGGAAARRAAVEFEMAPLRHAVHVLPDVMRAIFGRTTPTTRRRFAPLESRWTCAARPRMVEARRSRRPCRRRGSPGHGQSFLALLRAASGRPACTSSVGASTTFSSKRLPTPRTGRLPRRCRIRLGRRDHAAAAWWTRAGRPRATGGLRRLRCGTSGTRSRPGRRPTTPWCRRRRCSRPSRPWCPPTATP